MPCQMLLHATPSVADYKSAQLRVLPSQVDDAKTSVKLAHLILSFALRKSGRRQVDVDVRNVVLSKYGLCVAEQHVLKRSCCALLGAEVSVKYPCRLRAESQVVRAERNLTGNFDEASWNVP